MLLAIFGALVMPTAASATTVVPDNDPNYYTDVVSINVTVPAAQNKQFTVSGCRAGYQTWLASGQIDNPDLLLPRTTGGGAGVGLDGASSWQSADPSTRNPKVSGTTLIYQVNNPSVLKLTGTLYSTVTCGRSAAPRFYTAPVDQVVFPGSEFEFDVRVTASPAATFANSAGLPPGLTMSTDGFISGTVPADARPGRYPFSVTASNGVGTVSQDEVIRVIPQTETSSILNRKAVDVVHGFGASCLDADTWTQGWNGTKVQLWGCISNAPQQTWTWNHLDDTIRNQINGKCLDADLNTIDGDGTTVQLWDCNGSQQQRWYPGVGNTIVSAYSGRCLDADLNTIGTNGTPVQLWSCNGSKQQQWPASGFGSTAAFAL